MKYIIKVRVPLGAISKTVQDMQDSVNTCMHGFGFKEEAIITSLLIFFDLTTSRPLEPDERIKISGILEAQCKESFGMGEVESFEIL